VGNAHHKPHATTPINLVSQLDLNTCYSCFRRATERRLRKSGADSSKGLGFKARPHPKVHLGMDKMVQKTGS